METLSFLTLILAAATLLVSLYLVTRIKAVLYLLQQPVVKKMSPQLRLKPVRPEDGPDRNRNGGNRDGREGRENRGEGRGERNRGDRRDGRPEGSREGRENRGEGRGERRDGDRNRDGNREGRENRGERRDGDRNREGRAEGNREGRENRGEGRGERRDGDRNRDGNREGRENRGERRDGERRPPREFSETRDFAPSVGSEAAGTPAGLPPRRPLASVDAPSEANDAPVRDSAPSASETFVGSSDDMQHGRRTQLKKKPRFDFDEEETPAA